MDLNQDKVLKKVKIGIKIKLDPTLSQRIKLDNMFSEYKRAFNYVIDYINKIYNSYKLLKEPIEDECSECNKKRFLGYEKDNKLICGTCFYRKLSFITVRNTLFPKKRGEIIVKKFPYLTHGGIYQGVIKEATGNFSAYMKRINQRKRKIKFLEKEIKKLNEKFLNLKANYFYYNKEPKKMICNSCEKKKDIYMLDKNKEEGLCEECFNKYKTMKNDLKDLRKLKKPINIPEMKKNAILFYDYNLAYFNENYDIETSQPNTKEKTRIHTKIGDYQKKFIDLVLKENYYIRDGKKICKEGYHIKTTPKITKKKNKYYFVYPFRKECEIYINNEKIQENYKKYKPNIAILSFGLKKPINCLIYNGHYKFKIFGNGITLHKKEMREYNENKIIKLIQNNYLKKINKKKKELEKSEIIDIKRRINKFKKKTKHNLMNYIYRVNHYLSYQLINFLIENKVEFIIMRDLTKIKEFSYKGLLRKRLNKWAVIQLQNMIEYKANFNNISLFKFKYNDINKLSCSKCNEKIDKVILTDKLKEIKRFKCELCDYDNDYYFNDCINIHSLFNVWNPKIPKPKISEA